MSEITCVWCGRNLSGPSPHTIKCKKAPSELGLPERRRVQISHEVGFEMTDDWLRSRYLADMMSPLDLKEAFNLTPSQVYFLLKLFNIPQRGVSEARKLERCQEKQRATNLDRYGTANPSGNEEVKQRKRETFLQHYGVDNIFKDVSFRERLPGIMLSRYGKGSASVGKGMKEWWSSLTPEERERRSQVLHRGAKAWWANLPPEEMGRRKTFIIRMLRENPCTPRSSRLERRVGAALTGLGFEVKPQHFVNRKSYDFLLVGRKILIEVQGDYWHGNPKKYGPDEVLRFPLGKAFKASELWERDKLRRENAEKYGYKVLELWESDIPSDLRIGAWLSGILGGL